MSIKHNFLKYSNVGRRLVYIFKRKKFIDSEILSRQYICVARYIHTIKHFINIKKCVFFNLL